MTHHHNDFGSAFFWLWHSPAGVKALLGVSIFGFARKRWEERKRRRLLEEARCWPEARANVLTAQVKGTTSERKQHAGTFIGELTYSYMADEIEIGVYQHYFEREDVADAWARAMRATKQVRVLVDPEKKSRSVWIETEATQSLQAAGEEAHADDRAAAPLTGWRETLRLAALVVAALGGVIAVYLHLCIVLSMLTHQGVGPSADYGFVIAIHSTAIACVVLAQYVNRQRFPLRGNGGPSFATQDPHRNALLWLGGYSLLAFVAIFCWLTFGPDGPADPVLYGLSAAWLPAFAGAYLMCARAGADEDLGAGLVRR